MLNPHYHFSPGVIRCITITFLLAIFVAAAASLCAQPQPFVPHSVEIPTDASYRLADGSVYIVGNDGMEDLLNKLNALFTKTHPAVKFTMLLKGSSTGIGGLTAGVSAFAPMGREAWPTDVSGFRERFGYEPSDVRIGYDGYSRAGHKNPPGIYVNAKNPLAGLTVEQVGRTLTAGSPKGDITNWNQLGLGGAWAPRAIHVYGPRDEGGLATSLRYSLMSRRPFRRGYEGFAKLADVIAAVGADPFGIALVGFFDPAKHPEVKLVPLSSGTDAAFVLPTAENVQAGRYPLTPALHIYVNRAPKQPLDPLVKEYLRLVLSTEGQALIAAEQQGDEAYLPLDAATLGEELKKLE